MEGKLQARGAKEAATMQHLTPVGLSKDGKSLVLISNAGEEFAVPVDHRLRAALRGDQARLGQLEMKMESALRPRDIQARIRGGESAEEVAAAAQTTVDAIMGFAAPVLAERAHVAQSAQKSSIRRRSTETTTAAGTLDQAARGHLGTVGVRADEVDWDAWRREDGGGGAAGGAAGGAGPGGGAGGPWGARPPRGAAPGRADSPSPPPGRSGGPKTRGPPPPPGGAPATPAGSAPPARRLSSV